MNRNSKPVPSIYGTYKQLPFWRLRSLFRERGMFDGEVSRASGIPKPTLSRRMNGSKPWSADEITALCRLLDIPQQDIGRLFFPELDDTNEKAPAD